QAPEKFQTPNSKLQKHLKFQVSKVPRCTRARDLKREIWSRLSGIGIWNLALGTSPAPRQSTRRSVHVLVVVLQLRSQTLKLVHEPLVEPVMISEEKPLVGGVNHNRVVLQAGLFEVIQQTADVVVH